MREVHYDLYNTIENKVRYLFDSSSRDPCEFMSEIRP